MSVLNFLKQTYFTHFSKPPGRRSAYRLVQHQPPSSVVLLGLPELDFLERLMWFTRQSSDEAISITGVDLFEMRADDGALSLKDAHRELKATGAKVKLVPGDPHSGLSRVANTLIGTDLLLIASHIDPEAMTRAWFYVPRMLTDDSIVLRQTGEGEAEAYATVTLAEVQQLADENSPRRRAA